MKPVRLFTALLSIVCSAASLRGATLTGSVFLLPIDSQFTSVGRADYLDDLNHATSAVLSGMHSVHGAAVFEVAVYGNGTYSYDLQGPAEAGACFGTTLHVIGDPPSPSPLPTKEQTWSGATRCAPPPDPGGGGCGTNGGVCEQSESCPLILDLNADGIHTTGLDDPVDYWIDLQGQTETTAWTDPATEEAFLWLDLNHDRRAQVTELFGSRMAAPGGGYHAHGFDALLKYHQPQFGGNADGQISRADRAWSRLELWSIGTTTPFRSRRKSPYSLRTESSPSTSRITREITTTNMATSCISSARTSSVFRAVTQSVA
jgi:hypothetical protein